VSLLFLEWLAVSAVVILALTGCALLIVLGIAVLVELFFERPLPALTMIVIAALVGVSLGVWVL
jgi:hypothetical protein